MDVNSTRVEFTILGARDVLFVVRVFGDEGERDCKESF